MGGTHTTPREMGTPLSQPPDEDGPRVWNDRCTPGHGERGVLPGGPGVEATAMRGATRSNTKGRHPMHRTKLLSILSAAAGARMKRR